MDQVIATEIRRHRLRKGMSIRDLAIECQARGATQLTPPSLANIERGASATAKRAGRRVQVEELTVLAAVVGVPPALLMFPIGQSVSLRLPSGEVVDPWTAFRWWIGEFAAPTPAGSAAFVDPEWFFTSAPIIYFRQQDEILGQLRKAAEGAGQPHNRAKLERELEELRENMRRAGIDPMEADGLERPDQED